MKTRILFAILSVSLYVTAQTTPKEIMAKLPKIPTQQQLIDYAYKRSAAYHTVESTNAVLIFEQHLDSLVNNLSSTIDHEQSIRQHTAAMHLDKEIQTKYGHSIAELERMSLEQQDSFLVVFANNELKQSGFTMSIDQLMSMNDEERRQAAREAIINYSELEGITQDDIERMEDMDQEEQTEYILEKLVNDKIRARENADFSNIKPNKDGKYASELRIEQHDLEIRFKNVDRRIKRLYNDADAKTSAIWNARYANRWVKLQGKLSNLYNKNNPDQAKIVELQRQQDFILHQYYAEIMPLHYEAVQKAMLLRSKAQMEIGRRLDIVLNDLAEIYETAGEYASVNMVNYEQLAAFYYLREAQQYTNLHILDEEEED